MRMIGFKPKRNSMTISKGGRSLPGLVMDEFMYMILRRIARRALRRGNKIPPICISSNDLIAHRIISTGLFESSQLETLDHIIRDRMAELDRDIDRMGLFIDIGANVGIFSTRYAKHFDKTIAIEANPVTFKLLEANLALQNCQNVTAVCVAASDAPGDSAITIREEGNLGGASILGEDKDAASGFLTIPVKMETLETIVQSHEPDRRIDLIKVDVEGHEAAALRGARTLIKRDKPVILYERTSLSDGREIDQILKDCGYENFCLFERVVYFDGVVPKSALQIRKLPLDDIVNSALVCAY